MTPRVLHLAKDLSLPLDTVTEKLCWLGRTGSGKTYGAMKLAELMLEAGAQVGALDPVGVWRALRVPAEKGGQSFEVVVFGGLYGDLPLEPHAGDLIADLVVDRGLSFVLDVSQFIPAEQQRFVRAFADRFFHRKKSAPSAVHLFMEECQEFIPENPSGEEAKTLGVMQRLWKLGRNFGIGGSLISQRPQEISKKALNMSGTMFAFQMTGPQERKTVKAWVADHGVATDIESVLQTLKTGQPHVESPTFLEISKTVRILPRVTADLSSTPKVGASTAAKRPLTPIDVERLKESMAATIEKAKADDPRELRKQIAALKVQLEKGAHIMRDKVQPAPVEKFVLKDGQLARAERVLAQIDKAADRFGEFEEDLRVTAKEIRDAIAKTAAPVMATLKPQREWPKPEDIAPRRSFDPPERPRARAASGNVDVDLPPGELATLTAALQYPDGLDRKRLGILTGYKRSSRDAYINRLSTKGLVEVNGALLYPTDAGRAALNGHFEPLPTGNDLIAYWRARLPEGERKTLEVLLKGGPRDVAREEIDQATDYKRSSRDAYLVRLKARGLVEFSGRGTVRASEELFS